METDEVLYYRYLNGDENSLRQLMERYGDQITLYIAGYINDVHDAEDLMMDAFLRVIMKKPHIWNNCFKAYLYKTARNLALRFASKQQKNSCFGFEQIEKEHDGEMLVENIVQAEEERKILTLCMEKLNPDYREALYLIYFEDMSYKDVAQVIGKTQKQIENLAYRGKKALKTLLAEEGIFDAYNR